MADGAVAAADDGAAAADGASRFNFRHPRPDDGAPPPRHQRPRMRLAEDALTDPTNRKVRTFCAAVLTYGCTYCSCTYCDCTCCGCTHWGRTYCGCTHWGRTYCGCTYCAGALLWAAVHDPEARPAGTRRRRGVAAATDQVVDRGGVAYLTLSLILTLTLTITLILALALTLTRWRWCRRSSKAAVRLCGGWRR